MVKMQNSIYKTFLMSSDIVVKAADLQNILDNPLVTNISKYLFK